MDLDNPSYFAVPTDEPDCSLAQIRRKKRNGTSESSSEVSLTRQLTPPKYNSNRRDFRALLRSVSSNSADSNHELLIMGEPRLSDMAPSLAYKHPSRSNSLKKAQENAKCLQMPMSEEEGSDGIFEEDEVFLADDGVRYSNFTAIKRISNGNSSSKRSNSPRRHSISAFNARDRTSSVASSSRSFKGDFSAPMQEHASAASTVDEHSLRHMSHPRKRCLMCSKDMIKKFARTKSHSDLLGDVRPKPKEDYPAMCTLRRKPIKIAASAIYQNLNWEGNFSKPATNMDDILIVSLKSSEPANLWVDYFASYFDQISKQASRKSPFKIKNVYLEDALTPNIEDKKFIEGATGVKLQLVVVCPGFLDFAAQHPEECTGLAKLLLPDRTLALLLGVTDDDVTDAHKNALPSYFQWQRQSVGQDQDQTFTKKFLNQAMTILSKIWKQQSSVTAQEKSCFSVTPKKIKQGQNSIFIILTNPLQKDDSLKISLERNGELHEIKSVKRRNPYVIKITVPENLIDITAIVSILVEKNGNIIGSRPVKCESKFRELDQILRSVNNPVEFMCQTMGFSPADREHLDNWLVHGFQKNLPPHFNLFGTHSTPFAASIAVRKQSNEEFPTLLHFAAKFGLEKLAAQLMDCPGAEIAYDVRNVFGMTPIEIAEGNGHNSLSSTLKTYKSMQEVSSCYTTLKHFSLRSKPEEDDEGYLKPREIDNLYKLCPAPRPLNPEMARSCPTPIVTPSSECGSSLYLAMDRTAIAFSREDLRKTVEEPTSPKKDFDRGDHRSPSPNARKQKANAIVEDKFQRELAEIITDFKNNVHSLAQVEKLVEEWKNRNDVQKSFKEKQDQLNQMRLSYEKMQQEYKAKTKKSSPVDKFMKLFSRQSKADEQSEEMTSENVISGPALALNQSARPISSLSTSSSGSSGRMSTISGCSVGDSGTHSDNEDRKLMLSNSQADNDFKELDFNKGNLELNYTPVPAPKPVKFPNMHHFETIEENKPVSRPDTLSISEQFYIQFPPNGQPVSGFLEDAQSESAMDCSKNNYMNIPGPPSSHEYINYNPAS